jgi:site-specific recombinase XerD
VEYPESSYNKTSSEPWVSSVAEAIADTSDVIKISQRETLARGGQLNNFMKTENQKITPSPLKKYVDEFLEYCEITKNQSRNTISAYHRYLFKFADFAQSLKATDPSQINMELVKKYRLYLNRHVDAKGKTLKMITQNYHLIALRAFLKFLAKQDVETMSAEKIELPKNPERQVEFLEPDELKRLMDAVASEKEEILRLRDYAIMETLFSTGLRVSEAAGLRRDAINLDRREFTVRGKGDKLRLVFLSDEAAEALKKYLAKRKDNSKALFLGHGTIGKTKDSESEISKSANQSEKIASDQKRIEKEMQTFSCAEKNTNKIVAGLTPRQIQRIIKKYCLVAGIVKKVTPHTLRHSFATDLLQNGADIRSVQTLLGHASITTTQIYTHITNKGLRDIHKKFHNKGSD